MALTATERAAFERWCGPVADADEASVEARIARLGSALVAALEVLMIRRAEFASYATRVSSGDDRSDHTENLRALDRMIGELVAAILGDPLITLNPEADALVDQATGASIEATTSIAVTARNRRRG